MDLVDGQNTQPSGRWTDAVTLFGKTGNVREVETFGAADAVWPAVIMSYMILWLISSR